MITQSTEEAAQKVHYQGWVSRAYIESYLIRAGQPDCMQSIRFEHTTETWLDCALTDLDSVILTDRDTIVLIPTIGCVVATNYDHLSFSEDSEITLRISRKFGDEPSIYLHFDGSKGKVTYRGTRRRMRIRNISKFSYVSSNKSYEKYLD